MIHFRSSAFFALILLFPILLFPAMVFGDSREALISAIDNRFEQDREIAHTIWDFAELGFLEVQSSALLQESLTAEGFRVKTGVAGIPTAFIAEAGSGQPVIAVLAEFDALPGITQSASPLREEIPENAGGHACGHHLFGTASVSAAIVLKHWLADNKIEGTIRVYGTPAEEGGSGKVYMVREGLFDDVDAVLSWHPGDVNRAQATPTLANRSARFNFRGVSAHAAAAPEKARSALDGVEAFDFMVNLMREHVPQETRIHYVITSGGEAPNVVPDYAQVYYYVRHPDPAVLVDIWERIETAAKGAASGTGTSVEWEIMHGNLSLLPNSLIAGLMQKNLESLGGISYSEEEQVFAETIYQTLTQPQFELGSEQTVLDTNTDLGMGSTDVGDISWNVPTAEFTTATWVPGTPPHSWQAIAAGGTDIGIKGLQLAAKTLALTAADFFETPELAKQAHDELIEERGADFIYTPLLGDRAPALDFRLK